MSDTQEQELAAALYKEIEAREKAERELAELRERIHNAPTFTLDEWREKVAELERERDEALAALRDTETQWVTKAAQQLLSAADLDDVRVIKQLASTAFHIMEDQICSKNRAALEGEKR